jgi:CubicO group peptidase (beta-lactamase class C family)
VLPAGTPPFRPASSAALPAARQKALQMVLDDAIAVFHASGITAAVTSADGSWAGSAGTGGGGHAPVPAAMMNIGSITNTFTAAEIVYLAGRGLLDLDAPASRYLHAALLARGPTVRQLLSMTSGLPEFFTDAYASGPGRSDPPLWDLTPTPPTNPPPRAAASVTPTRTSCSSGNSSNGSPA